MLAREVVSFAYTRTAAAFAPTVPLEVDGGGRTVAALRMDGNAHGIFEFAQAKAEAAAAWGFPTSAMEEGAKSTPGFASAPYVVTVAGGVPVF